MKEKTKLRWHEYLWAGLPLLLVLVGGAIGGLVGATATNYNLRLFRSTASRSVKYLLSGLILLMAPLIAFALSSLFLAFFGPRGGG
ncbi:hypothetical protein [Variovorax sp. DXTD-1]|uniref:hypothetical protein n=1 Tax=Variovorax sp. DXTD-1 TaxID=2495592 RepID=UPI000F8718BD|nr:hypothetical protein [Variovorax sp. DXTD-1]RST45035.1 hypothetical protein EJI00_24445 [Variovorax sp. DXTD-1]